MAYESIITDELPAGITLVDGLGYEYITGRLEAQKVDFETKWGPRNGQPDHFRHARIIVPKDYRSALQMIKDADRGQSRSSKRKELFYAYYDVDFDHFPKALLDKKITFDTGKLVEIVELTPQLLKRGETPS